MPDGVRLWVVAPGRLKSLVKTFPAEGFEWCYFGTDIRKREGASALLSRARKVSIGEELNALARETKQPFLDWMAEIGSRQRSKRTWWASNVGSKSTLQTDFFLLVCYTRLVTSWLSENREMRRRLLIVEDPWLAWVLRRQFARDPRVAFYVGCVRRCVLNSLYWLSRVSLAVTYVILWSLWSALLARIYFPRKSVWSSDGDRRAVIIYSWIEEKCFSLRGKFQDPYTGRLDEILSRNGACVRRLTPLKVSGRLIRRLRDFTPTFIIASRYLSLGHIMRSLRCWFKIDDLHRLSTFKECDFRFLFYRELLHEWGHPGFFRYHLWYLAMCTIAEELGDRIKCIVYPFENQQWEKMLCLAFKRQTGGARLIGYQHASVPPLLLSYFLGKDECAFTPLPDYIIVNSDLNLDLLKRGGFPPERVCNGGALRFEHLLGGGGRREPRKRAPGEPSRVLVAMSTSPVHSASLLQDLVELFPSPFLDENSRCRIRFILKCHPDLPMMVIARGRQRLPEWITDSGQPLDELIRSCDLLLFASPTGSWRQASLAGLPVVKYRSEFLDIDSDDGLGDKLLVASRETLKPQLYAMLSGSLALSVEPQMAPLKEAYSPVNERMWLELICA